MNGPFIPQREMNSRATPRFAIFVFGLLAIFATASYALFSQATILSAEPAVGLISFFLLIVLGESFPLKAPTGNAFIGVSGTICWALVILFDPFWAVSCAFSAMLVAEVLIQHRTLLKSIFNATQVGLSTMLAGFYFVLIKGSLGFDLTLRFFLAFTVVVLVYWAVNTSLVSVGAWALYGAHPYRFWQSNFRWYWIYELTSSPIALAIAFSYERLALVGLILLVLPILLVRLSYSQYLNLKKTYWETVRTLIKIIEMHDPYTAGHSDRVATYARRLCEALGLSSAKTERIELAAYLHDLGKIHLDLTSIVRKAGRLTEEERRMVRLHPVMSADLANQVTFFQGEIEDMILHHHENWDGTGYPHGLKGEAIPLGARIILLADAFDAMTTIRIYRDALDIELVKDEFRRFSGIQFDPELVPVFLEKVVGDGSRIISQPIDEPLEGRRAHSPEVQGKTVPFNSEPRRVMG